MLAGNLMIVSYKSLRSTPCYRHTSQTFYSCLPLSLGQSLVIICIYPHKNGRFTQSKFRSL